MLLLGLLIPSAMWTAWHARKSVDPVRNREDAIACMSLETLEAYRNEAVTDGFAAMHPLPKESGEANRSGKMIRFEVEDGQQANGYLVASKRKSDRWLIVIQEWWGLNDNIRDEADKYHRDLGDMNVLAVDMYDGRVASTPDSAMRIMRSVDMGRLSAIIKGAIAYAGPKAGIYSVGWCFGGMWSLQTAIIAGARSKGTVMFYGRPESNPTKLATIESDVLGFFGNRDQSPSPALVNEFERNMQAAGKKLTVHRYEAGHGFANPSNPNFNKEAAEDAYSKAIAFLKAH